MAVKWLDEPEAHDYDAAAAYLSMLAEKDAVDKTVAALKAAKPVYQVRILRLGELPPEISAAQPADLVLIQITHVIAHDLRVGVAFGLRPECGRCLSERPGGAARRYRGITAAA